MSEIGDRMTQELMTFLSGTAGNYDLDPDKDMDDSWKAIGQEIVRIYGEILAEQGLVVVPQVANEEMLEVIAQRKPWIGHPEASQSTVERHAKHVRLAAGTDWRLMISAALQQEE